MSNKLLPTLFLATLLAAQIFLAGLSKAIVSRFYYHQSIANLEAEARRPVLERLQRMRESRLNIDRDYNLRDHDYDADFGGGGYD